MSNKLYISVPVFSQPSSEIHFTFTSSQLHTSFNKNVHARMLYSLDHIHNPLWTMGIHNVSFVNLLDFPSFWHATSQSVSQSVDFTEHEIQV